MDALLIITPETDDDAISEGLRRLTLAAQKALPDEDEGFGLGGEGGYGVNFENDTFMMHRFCWCEREDCIWCAGCDCPASSYHYSVDGKETDYRGWMDFYMLHVYGMTDAQMEAEGIKPWGLRPKSYERKSKEANSRRSTRHDPVCDYCTGKGIFACEAVIPGKGAPNFWHKSSGTRVIWYKWIGRDNEVHMPEGTDFEAIIAECIASLPSSPPHYREK
jgi:hypothetical protein